MIAVIVAFSLDNSYFVLPRISCLVLIRPTVYIMIEFLLVRWACPILVSTFIEFIVGFNFILWVVIPVEILRCSNQ
jgi:hypothetical protein